MRYEHVVLERDGHWFHDDNLLNRYYYKNHEDYLTHRKTYLAKCLGCLDYIYPSEKIEIKIVSRVGGQPYHKRCYS